MAASWDRTTEGFPALFISIKISAVQLASDSLIDHVSAALVTSGIAPSSVVLDITETALVTSPAAVTERLQPLRRLGVRLALDNFGTGYSSLGNLFRFPLDMIKINGAFIDALEGPSQGAGITRWLFELGRTLSLEMVAKGVGREAQCDLLRAENCGYAQGNLYGTPMDAYEVEQYLLAHIDGGQEVISRDAR